MTEEIASLLYRISRGEKPSPTRIRQLGALLVPYAVYAELCLVDTALSFVEVCTIVGSLDIPRPEEEGQFPETEAGKSRRYAKAYAYVAATAASLEKLSITHVLDCWKLLQPSEEARTAHEQEALTQLLEKLLVEDDDIYWRAAKILRDFAIARPLLEESEVLARLIVSYLFLQSGLPMFGLREERRDAYVQAMQSGAEEALVDFLCEETAASLAILQQSEQAPFPRGAAQLGVMIVERQKELLERLKEEPIEDPALVAARGAEVEALASWLDYLFARIENNARGPLYEAKRSSMRSDWAEKLLGSQYQANFVGKASCVGLRITAQKDIVLPGRSIRLPTSDANLYVYVAASPQQLHLVLQSPLANAIRDARKNKTGKGPRTFGFGSSHNPVPTPQEIAEARIELHGPPLAMQWEQAMLEGWLFFWVDRLSKNYEEEILNLNDNGVPF